MQSRVNHFDCTILLWSQKGGREGGGGGWSSSSQFGSAHTD